PRAGATVRRVVAGHGDQARMRGAAAVTPEQLRNGEWVRYERLDGVEQFRPVASLFPPARQRRGKAARSEPAHPEDYESQLHRRRRRREAPALGGGEVRGG